MKTCLFTLCLWAVPVFGQDKPTIKVLISRCEWKDAQKCEDARLSHNQLQWWRDSGQKRFPRVQLVESRDEADWILFWAITDVPFTTTTPTTATTTRIPGTDTTQTTINHGQQEQKVTIFVEADARRITHTDGAITFPKMPDHFTKHTGRWLWSKPDKDALEKLLKAIVR